MADTIRINESEGIIEVVSFGAITRQDIEKTKGRLQSVLAEHSIDRVLIDTTRVHTAPDPFDILEVWDAFPHAFKTALLITKSSPITEDVAFAETVGVNRGHRVRLFSDNEEARQWLCSADD